MYWVGGAAQGIPSPRLMSPVLYQPLLQGVGRSPGPTWLWKSGRGSVHGGFGCRYSKVATTQEAMKQNPSCLGYIGDDELPSYEWIM